MTTTDGRPEATRHFEFAAALLLGVAALLTAYASMRSAIVGDEVLEGFTLSSQHYSDANSTDDANMQVFMADQALFLRYAEATFNHDDGLARYLRTTLFDDELDAAVDWWEQQQADEDPPESPFEAGTPYRFDNDAAEATAKGDTAFDAAKRADGRNDRFDQATALLSITLFAVGLAVLVRTRRARYMLAALAVLGLAAGGVLIGIGELG